MSILGVNKMVFKLILNFDNLTHLKITTEQPKTFSCSWIANLSSLIFNLV